MTGPQWDEAFDKGDPDALGEAILAALRQAHEEHSAADIGELARTDNGDLRPPYVLELVTRAGQILVDTGAVRLPAGTERAEQGPRDLNAEREFESGENQ